METVTFFLLELYLAIDQSNFASENTVTKLSELQMHVQEQPLAFNEYFVRQRLLKNSRY